MNSYYKNTILNLISKNYYELSSDSIEEISENMIFLAKYEPPIWYTINLFNYKSLELSTLEDVSNALLCGMASKKNGAPFKYLVEVNIIICEKKEQEVLDFINSKYVDYGTDSHIIWWAVFLDSKSVVAGKNMPNSIDCIANVLRDSFNTSPIDNTQENASVNKYDYKGFIPYITYFFLGITILSYILILFFGGIEKWTSILGSNYEKIVFSGEYYRLITHILVHADIFHLASNCLYLNIFGRELEKYVGHILIIPLYIGSALAGGILSLLLSSPFTISVGASGGVFGLIGAAFILAKIYNTSEIEFNYGFMLFFIVIQIGLGSLSDSIDNYAHIGGLIFGILFTIAYYLIKDRKKKETT